MRNVLDFRTGACSRECVGLCENGRSGFFAFMGISCLKFAWSLAGQLSSASITYGQSCDSMESKSTEQGCSNKLSKDPGARDSRWNERARQSKATLRKVSSFAASMSVR